MAIFNVLCHYVSMDTESAIRKRFKNIEWALDERLRRLYAASEAKVLGHGGITLVQKATGVARNSIKSGLKELQESQQEGVAVDGVKGDGRRRQRRIGGGRKASVIDDIKLLTSLESLVEPVTCGDPQSALRWTCKSLRQLASELRSQGYAVSHTSIGDLLKKLGYSLQGNRKSLEGGKHPDRNAQFEFINVRAEDAIHNGQPVISVGTKKKELVGQYKNGGKELRRKGEPEQVKVYDFIDKDLGKVNPYGVYDITNNLGWVGVGTDHDTASFAVATIRRWWFEMGKELYPDVRQLLITADAVVAMVPGCVCGSLNCKIWPMNLESLFESVTSRRAQVSGIKLNIAYFLISA